MERSDSIDWTTINKGSFSEDKLFDASQYAFFGRQNPDKLDFGCLEEDEDNPATGIPDDEYRLFDREEEPGTGSLSDLDDLSTIFSKLNRSVSGPRHPGVIGDRSGSISRESSSASVDLPEWLDQHISDTESSQGSRRWSSQSHLPSDPKPLFRASSYPTEQHQFFTEPILAPTSSLPSFSPNNFPSPRHRSDLNLNLNLNLSPLSSPSNLHLTNIPHGSRYGSTRTHLTQFSQAQTQWANQLLANNFQQKLLLSPHFMSPHSIRNFNPFALQPYLYDTIPTIPHSLHKYGSNDSSQSQRKSKGRISRQGSDNTNPKTEKCRVNFRSKYMTSEEIESILNMQHAATHSNDPYINDYYHQARLAKTASNSKNRFHPAHFKEGSAKSRNASDSSQPQINLDSHGRISFSLIRRPQPLFEPENSSNENEKRTEKSLEQEPMLAARIMIEDAISVILDVDDIDRILNSQPNDAARTRRQILLEGLAAAFQLVDPLNVNGSNFGPKDDIVFLRVISLPKGQKLIVKYLNLLSPTSDLTRIVCMTIFRHLRFLFGGVNSDTLTTLSKTVANSVSLMDLNSLSACLAAVVCSPEQPPLRPIGSSSGDGATVVLKAVLERATQILTGVNLQNATLWQASFDAFFGLLTKYCLSKYDSLVQAMYAQGTSADVVMTEAGKAISREMPVELLRASLPHTDERQRKMLVDFSQRSMHVGGFSGRTGSGGHVAPESVRG